jgi:RHS repeat-associated protein
MQQPGRAYTNGSQYRYGFNGKEDDKDIESGAQDYGMRIYDTRIGKFLSVDPITSKYPMLTPYQFASNRPIQGIDQDGLEFFKKNDVPYTIDYKPVLSAPNFLEGASNSVHNLLSLAWNGTLGTVLEIGRGTNNYFAGGYKEPAGFPVQDFIDGTNESYRYFTRTPLKQQLKDLGNAATDLHNYEIIPSLFIVPTEAFMSRTATVETKAVTSVPTVIRGGDAMSISITSNKNLFGGNIINLVKNRTTTVLGRFAEGTENVIATGMFRTGENTGGLNLLSLSRHEWSEAVNAKWLQEAIHRNDVFRVVSDPTKIENIWVDGVVGGKRTSFGTEVKTLEDAGYKYNAKAAEYKK